MTKFVVDCGVVLQLASEGIEVPPEHELFAPTLLRSQTLSALHEAVHGGVREHGGAGPARELDLEARHGGAAHLGAHDHHDGDRRGLLASGQVDGPQGNSYHA